MKLLLAINAGSSSVKVTLFAIDDAAKGAKHSSPRPLAEAQVSGLTSPPATLKYVRGDKTVHKDQDLSTDRKDKIDSQPAAFRVLLETLVNDDELTPLRAASDIRLAAHRIVHGGDFNSPQVLDADTLHRLEELSDLAPLHNAPGLAIVRACLGGGNDGEGEETKNAALLPGALNVACLDTSFHTTIPAHIRTYPIAPAVAESNGLRKYGFHGLSYAFIARAAARFLERPVDDTNLIALHLGSGASACAIRGGRSWDTSMGLTPLAGLPGATRSGSVDPSLVFHYASDVGKLSPSSTADLHISRAEEILNKESGWKALTGTTDFGAITSALAPTSDASAAHRAACQLAFDLLVDRVCGFVGAYYVALGGVVDALVFAGGIGERSALLRRAVVERCACLGFALDEAKAEGELAMREGVAEVGGSREGSGGTKSRENRAHRVLVVATDEQFEMARECAEEKSLWK